MDYGAYEVRVGVAGDSAPVEVHSHWNDNSWSVSPLVNNAAALLCALPPLAARSEHARLANLMFEECEVERLYFANKSALALVDAGVETGVAVDLGHRSFFVVPVAEGQPQRHATVGVFFGGEHVARHSQRTGQPGTCDMLLRPSLCLGGAQALPWELQRCAGCCSRV